MAGDGSGQFGGGGSIEWEVSVNDGSIPATSLKPSNPKGYTQKAKDREGVSENGRYFVIRIKPTTGIQLGNNGDILVAVPIRPNSPGQISVEWSFTEGEKNALGGNFKPI